MHRDFVLAAWLVGELAAQVPELNMSAAVFTPNTFGTIQQRATDLVVVSQHAAIIQEGH